MPLDPSIALNVRPVQFESPVNMMGQMYQLQNAAQASQLNQLKMQEMERDVAERNAMRPVISRPDFDVSNPAHRRELISVAPVAGQELINKMATGAKTFSELETAKLSQTKAQLGLAAQILSTAKDQPTYDAARQKLKLNGLPIDQMPSVFDPRYVQNELMQGVEMDKQLTHQLGLAQLEETKRGHNLTDARERQRLEQDARSVVYQQDASGNVVALPSKLKAGEVPRAITAVAPGAGMTPLQPKPSEAESKERISLNQMKSTIKGALDAVEKNPDAFGMSRGLQGETLGGRLASSEENQARAYVFNVISGVIKERAGTAQSAAEHDTLMRFLPSQFDNDKQIKDKLQGFQQYLSDKEAGTTKSRNFNPAGTPKPAAKTDAVDLSNPLLK